MKIITCSWLLLIATLTVGCQAPAEPSGPTAMRVSVATPEDYDRLFEVSTDVLRKYYLEPDRQDRTQGVITSRPDTTGAWFEFWRPQPSPAYTWWESNIHTIRRIATVSLRKADPSEYEIDVAVNRYQYSLEERQIDNPAAALRLYSAEAPTASGSFQKPSEGGEWLPLGRDGLMETQLLNEILVQYEKQSLNAAPTNPADTQPAAKSASAALTR